MVVRQVTKGCRWLPFPTGIWSAGNSASFGSGSSQIYLIRTNIEGDTLWTRTYGGDGLYAANSLISTGSGDFVVCGTYYDPGTGELRHIFNEDRPGRGYTLDPKRVLST